MNPVKQTNRKALLSTPPHRPINLPQKSKCVSTGAKKTMIGKLGKEKIPAKGTKNVSKAKALVSKAKNVSTDQKAKVSVVKTAEDSANDSKAKVMTGKTPHGSSSPAGAVIKEKVKEKTAVSKNLPDSKPTDSKINGPESAMTPKDTAKIGETGNMPVSESNQQTELVKVDAVAKATEGVEPLKVGETANKVTEPMDVEPCNLGTNGEKMTDIEFSQPKTGDTPPPTSIAETSIETPPKPTDTSTQSPNDDIKTPKTSSEESSQVMQSTLPEPEPTAQGLETKMGDSQRPAESSALDRAQTEEQVEMDTKPELKGMLKTF